jgi:hypothetical protein
MKLNPGGAGRHKGLIGFAVGVAAAMTIAGGGVALASIPSSSTAKFTGCVAKTGGALRVIDAQAGKKCKSSEKTISWSKGWTHRGAWASGTAYKPGDVVTAGGSSYVAKVKSTGAAPASSPTAWGLLAAAGANGTNGAQGAKGDKGDKGDQGIPGPVNITYQTSSQVLANGITDTYFVTCSPLFSGINQHVTGGGVTSSATAVAVQESGPYDSSGIFGDIDTVPDDGWKVTVRNFSGGNATLTIYAACVDASSVS